MFRDHFGRNYEFKSAMLFTRFGFFCLLFCLTHLLLNFITNIKENNNINNKKHLLLFNEFLTDRQLNLFP